MRCRQRFLTEFGRDFMLASTLRIKMLDVREDQFRQQTSIIDGVTFLLPLVHLQVRMPVFLKTSMSLLHPDHQPYFATRQRVYQAEQTLQGMADRGSRMSGSLILPLPCVLNTQNLQTYSPLPAA